MDNEQRAFTSYYGSGISLKLVNKVTVSYGDKSVQVDALWDTGATGTCVSHDVASALAAPSVGKCKMRTPSGEKEMDTFCVDVILPNNVKFDGLMVVDSEIGSQGIGILVGMDIISRGDFAVTNFDGKTVFTYRHPSQSKIDFVKDVKLRQLIGTPHGMGKNRKRKK